MNKELNKLGIGQIAIFEAWLDHYGLQYDRNNIKRLVGFNDKTEGFEITLNRTPVEVTLGEGTITPQFTTDGTISIRVCLSK